jgi:hypothetical protein
MQLSPSDPDVQTIVSRIRTGDLDLQPDFQRGEVWSLQKKRRLIDSILREWHVPPIHTVIVKDTGKQEVLDGQQRLVSIRDFCDNRFSVEGTIEPSDERIKSLDGLLYKDLPPWARRIFDQFTIRVFRITDYKPDEPGELFYRLNRITNLTAAEQRNAFFGPVRKQVKELVSYLTGAHDVQELFGFSNARMAYDDIVAKLLTTLESGSLNIKITAGSLSDRYRSREAINQDTFAFAKYILRYFQDVVIELPRPVRFNRATMLTWLLFFSRILRSGTTCQDDRNLYSSYVLWFEAVRSRSASHEPVETLGDFQLRASDFELFSLFNDRSTARVADVSSVIYRDFIVIYFARRFFYQANSHMPLAEPQTLMIEAIENDLLRATQGSDLESLLAARLDFRAWGLIR